MKKIKSIIGMIIEAIPMIILILILATMLHSFPRLVSNVFGTIGEKDNITDNTIGTIIDKEYNAPSFLFHQNYQFLIKYLDKESNEMKSEWIYVSPTTYNAYDIGDKYDSENEKGKNDKNDMI